jgi:hypothetical protein
MVTLDDVDMTCASKCFETVKWLRDLKNIKGRRIRNDIGNKIAISALKRVRSVPRNARRRQLKELTALRLK